MKNKNEGMKHSVVSEWEDLLKKEVNDLFILNKPFSTYAMKQEIEVFYHAVQFAEQNAAKIPAVKDLIDAARNLRDDVYEMESLLEHETVQIRMELDEAIAALRSKDVAKD